MSDPSISPQLLQQLRERAAQQGRTVEELLQGWLEAAPAPAISYRDLLEKTSEIITLFDTDHRHLYISPVIEKITGVAPQQMIGKTNRELGMPQEQVEMWERVQQEVIDSGQERLIEFSFPTADGPRFFETQITPLCDDAGHVCYLRGVTRDITERKRAEAALRESEARFRLVLTASSVIVAQVDRDLRYTWIYNPHPDFDDLSVLGKRDDEIAVNEGTKQLVALKRQVVETGRSASTEITFPLSDDELTYSILANPLKDDAGKVVGAMTCAFNITERKQMEAALRESESRFKLLTGLLSDYVLLHEVAPDGSLGVEWVIGESFKALTGYDTSGVNYWEIVHPDDVEHIRQAVARTLANERTITETRMRTKSGQYIWISTARLPIRDETQGRVVRYYSVITDITERKQAEEALRESELQYRSLFEQSNDAVFILDMQGRYVRTNQRAAELFGYDPDELLRLSYHDLVVPAQHQQSDRVLERLLAGERIPLYERSFRCKDGTELLAEINVEMIRDEQGQPLYIQSIVRDITKRKQAEEALRESELQYRSLFEQSNDAVFILDMQGRHVRVNQRAAEMFGYDLDEIVGLSYRDLVVPTQHQQSERVLERLGAGERIPPYERSFRRKDGTELLAEINVEMIRDEQGQPLYIQSVVRDITERKQAQQREIELALEKERLRLLRQFIEKASHEFRTPLATISTSTFLMLKPQEPEKLRSRAELVTEQVARMARLVDMLLLMTRLESGAAPTRVPVDVAALFKKVCRQMAARYGDHPRLHCDEAAGLPAIAGDADDLAEAFSQILDNAYRCTPAEGQISVSAAVVGGCIRLAVQDTGPGIALEDQPHVFETFWRHDVAHSTPGFGLGLSIAQKIVESHGGHVELESRPGQGSRFTICLPVHHPEPA